jgi:hypothetical protein
MVRIQDAILSVSSLGVLVAGLMAINNDMRRHVMNIVAGNLGELTVVTAPVNKAARMAVHTLNDYQTDSGPLFAFAAFAVVLFGLMFKA